MAKKTPPENRAVSPDAMTAKSPEAEPPRTSRTGTVNVNAVESICSPSAQLPIMKKGGGNKISSLHQVRLNREASQAVAGKTNQDPYWTQRPNRYGRISLKKGQ